MRVSSWGRGFCLILSFLTLNLQAAPSADKPIEYHKVNGYDVYLVHIPNLPEAYILSHIPTGSHFDEPTRYAGRAHLWEHVIHLGSEKYPTTEIRDAALDRLGAKTNAGTGAETVNYFIELDGAKILEAIDVIGDMFTRPRFDESAFLKEREVVKNEALSYQQRDVIALMNILELQLRPDDHPLKMYDVGTQEQLSAMTLSDLKKLFYSDYLPENVRIVVVNDFAKAQVSAEQILSSIEGSFKSFPVPAEYSAVESGVKKEFPIMEKWSERKQDAPIAVEIESLENKRMMLLQFDVSSEWSKQNREVVEVLMDYINAQSRGSLNHQLQEQGWISTSSVYETILNNRAYYKHMFVLTPQGIAERNKVVEKVFAFIGRLSRGEMSSELIEYLKFRNVDSYKKHVTEGGDQASSILTSQFVKGQNPVDLIQTAFDFGRRFSAVNHQLVAEAASRLLNPEQVLMSVVAPEFKSTKNAGMDVTFQRGIRLVPHRDVIGVWRNAFQTGLFEKQLVAVDFEVAKVPDVFARTPIDHSVNSRPRQRVFNKNVANGRSDTFTVETDLKTDKHAAQIRLRLVPRSSAYTVALSVFINSFSKEFNAYKDYVFSIGESVSISAKPGYLEFSTEGNTENGLKILEWFSHQFKNYSPSAGALKWSLDAYLSKVIGDQGAFSAHVTLKEAHKIFGHHRRQEVATVQWLIREEAKNPGTIVRMVQKSLSYADINAAFVGNWDVRAAEAVTQQIRALWPQSLTKKHRLAIQEQIIPLQNKTYAERKLPGNRESDDFAQARLWQLKDLDSLYDTKSNARLVVLNAMLSKLIFDVNRTQKGLGYVHGSAAYPGYKSILAMFGETRGDDMKTGEIEKGWMEVIQRFKTASPELISAFEDAKQGLLLKLRSVSTPAEKAEELNINLGYDRSAQWVSLVAKSIEQLKFSDIQSLVAKYLAPSRPYLDVVMRGNPSSPAVFSCRNYFGANIHTTISGARSGL